MHIYIVNTMSTLAIARLLGGSRGQGRHFVTMGQSLMGREIVCLVIVVISCHLFRIGFRISVSL